MSKLQSYEVGDRVHLTNCEINIFYRCSVINDYVLYGRNVTCTILGRMRSGFFIRGHAGIEEFGVAACLESTSLDNIHRILHLFESGVLMKILLFGGNGQVGRALQKQKWPDAWDLKALTRIDCNFLQPSSIGKAVQDFEPDLVINTAALTDIDICQSEPEKAKEINFHAVANLAAQCDTFDAPLIHISTDYVFDGANGNKPYGPDDAMNPVNVYGESKMMGEEAARHGLYWHVILRTSLVFSAEGNNVLTKAISQINKLEEVSAVSDQVAAPTSADAVAEAVLTIVMAIMNGKGNGFGTFHLTGDPAISRFEFLQAIMEAYAPFTDRRPKLVPISASSAPPRVPRPPLTSLNTDKIREVYGIYPRLWRDDLALAVKEYVEKLSDKTS